MISAIFHYAIKIISRSKGRSITACAAYRTGDKLIDPDTGQTHDFTRKKGVMYSEILLPDNAPEDFKSRQILWDAVAEIECKNNSQLAREIEVALPKELNREKQIELTRKYIQGQFVDAGMCADWSLHDKGDGNPHVHILLTMRSIKPDGTWAAKEKKAYKLDENGEKIPVIDPVTGKQKIGARGRKLWQRETIQANNWNNKENAEIWRASWAELCNQYLDVIKAPHVDHRSYQRQHKNMEPTIHEGYVARQMEQRGERSERCEQNKYIRQKNHIYIQIQKIMTRIQNILLEKAGEIIGRNKYGNDGKDRTIDPKQRDFATESRRTKENDYSTLLREAEVSRLVAETSQFSRETKRNTEKTATNGIRRRERETERGFEKERTSGISR